MRLIFMGTPDFAVPVLKRLIDDGHDILAVFTQPDRPSGRGQRLQPPPVKLLALARSVPVHQPAKIKGNEEVAHIFEAAKADAAVVAAYGKILPASLLEIPRLGCINVHSSLLPKYRGAAPINWAVANGETTTGVTIMQMDAGMDTGPVWSQRLTEIGPEENGVELTSRLSRLGAELLSETLPKIESGSARPAPQDNSQATYAPMLKREDGLIDWASRASEIANRARGFQPWPGAYTIFRGSRLIIWRAKAVEPERAEGQFGSGDLGQSSAIRTSACPSGQDSQPSMTTLVQPGAIVSTGKSGMTVACGENTLLQLLEVQIEGKRRVSARDFANGARLARGDALSD